MFDLRDTALLPLIVLNIMVVSFYVFHYVHEKHKRDDLQLKFYYLALKGNVDQLSTADIRALSKEIWNLNQRYVRRNISHRSDLLYEIHPEVANAIRIELKRYMAKVPEHDRVAYTLYGFLQRSISWPTYTDIHG